MGKKEMQITQQEIVIYNGKNGEVKLNADFRNETVWATHKQIADIFGIERSGITKHINKIIYSGEIDKKSNVQFLHIPNSDRPVALFVYFLDKNNALRKNGQLLIDNNALAATALMIALSKPEEKEIMCNLVVNFICPNPSQHRFSP
jgi:phage regulator Rha-like protein